MSFLPRRFSLLSSPTDHANDEAGSPTQQATRWNRSFSGDNPKPSRIVRYTSSSILPKIHTRTDMQPPSAPPPTPPTRIVIIGAEQAELGSASCRERECQSVWNSVVAVSLYKQQTNKKLQIT